MIKFSYDETSGVLHCLVRGFLTLADAERYVIDIGRETRRARARAGRLKLLIDSSDGIIQAPEVMAKAAEGGTMIEGPGDRIAVIVGSTLGKVQTRRLLHNDQEQAFLSPNAAMTWLLAQDQAVMAGTA